MYKQYKQWKKVFASPYFLIPYGISFFVIATLLLNAALCFFIGLFANQGALSGGFQSFIKGFFTDSSSQAALPTFEVEWFFTFHFFGIYKLVYLLLYVILAFIVGKKIYTKRIAFRDILLGIKGTTRWTTMEEVERQSPKIPTNHEPYEGVAGIPLLHYKGFVYMDINKTNTLVVASTQSGKTEMFTYPFIDNIMRASVKDSAIILDIKGNILKNTKEEFEKFGFDVHVLNLLDPHLSIGFNPLELVKQAYFRGDIGKAQSLVQTLSFSFYNNPDAKDPMWQKTSIALLNALVLAVCEICYQNKTPEKVTLFTVGMFLMDLATNPDEDGLTDLDRYFGSLPPISPARRQFMTIEFSKGVTRSGIYTGTISELSKYMNDEIAKLTAQNDFDFTQITEGVKPVALFVIIKDWDDSLNDLVSTFLSQSSAVLSELAVRSKKSSLSRRVQNIYEELGNIPAIKGLERYAAVGLERGLIYHLIFQNRAKFNQVYGETNATDIMGSCGNQIYIMSDDYDDAEHFSKKLGETGVIAPNRHGDPMSEDKSYGEQEEERQLMKASELRLLRMGEWVVIRTKMRKDLKGKRIRPYPLRANLDEGTAMLHRHEYLMDYFNHPCTFDELGIEGTTQEIDLESLIIPIVIEQAEPEPADIALDASILEQPLHASTERSVIDMTQVEEVFHEETPILDFLTEDQYRFITSMVLEHTDTTTANYFQTLETLEEVKVFLQAPERLEVYEQVDYLLLKEGA
ncbi:type IV secretory system conjugative DNA transfer family protein [Listeria booriae]|uniref:VirD4-like conjugal transfer protein, CD1115 family n=1 Tax=Listeria booriae TaxID=1552123 RepID=UPI00162404AB|nr:type IV secretory system conjugative DNA transfer family protein [Listeria booriae]MBC1920314.1 type IV secretory system conjugative DNA transfer family protein [Listeria booriae]